jgi:hypothetical protein
MTRWYQPGTRNYSRRPHSRYIKPPPITKSTLNWGIMNGESIFFVEIHEWSAPHHLFVQVRVQVAFFDKLFEYTRYHIPFAVKKYKLLNQWFSYIYRTSTAYKVISTNSKIIVLGGTSRCCDVPTVLKILNVVHNTGVYDYNTSTCCTSCRGATN